ncbi:MAG TPA: zinc ribbon domain-containing protein [Blastocatellia bacterium]|jgi:hypothetical protein|nr:zinc ribbon domain-containing protein [Blastocatellia bacterium]
MYCPNCAAANNEGTKFCRSCGSNLSLVPQALTGRLPDERARRKGRRHRSQGPPSLSEGIVKAFTGLGFLMVSLALSFSPIGRFWWFWMLIPAFAMMGKGIAEIVSSRNQQTLSGGLPAPHLHPPQTQIHYPQDQYSPAPGADQLPPRNTGPIFPPPSVTENTTRHLDSARERAKEKN